MVGEDAAGGRGAEPFHADGQAVEADEPIPGYTDPRFDGHAARDGRGQDRVAVGWVLGEKEFVAGDADDADLAGAGTGKGLKPLVQRIGTPWIWLCLVAIALFLVEWFLYQKRITE